MSYANQPNTYTAGGSSCTSEAHQTAGGEKQYNGLTQQAKLLSTN